jgi:hypothetical protein
MDTPEFLIWAIEYTCPIRGHQNGSDPERTERQLRAARAESEARLEGRVFEGFCVEPPDGFRITEALAIYGGLEAVKQECAGCPANALAELASETLAGCYGIVPLPDDPKPIHDAIERGIEAAYPGMDWSELCCVTKPRWYGLWLDSPLSAEQLMVCFLVLTNAPIADERCRAAMRELQTALNAAFNAGYRLHVQLYPGGHVAGGWWLLHPHCPRCMAQWRKAAGRQCECCGYVGHPAPERKRRARGRRPYFALERLLGAEHAAQFLFRYQVFRRQRESMGPAQSPRCEGQPDSRRDG